MMFNFTAEPVLSIRVDTIDEFTTLTRWQNTDLYELRVDGLDSLEDFEKLKKRADELIVTVRSKDQGGYRSIEKQKKLEMIKDLTDIETKSNQNHLVKP